jgi:hypothetical protein
MPAPTIVPPLPRRTARRSRSDRPDGPAPTRCATHGRAFAARRIGTASSGVGLLRLLHNLLWTRWVSLRISRVLILRTDAAGPSTRRDRAATPAQRGAMPGRRRAARGEVAAAPEPAGARRRRRGGSSLRTAQDGELVPAAGTANPAALTAGQRGRQSITTE